MKSATNCGKSNTLVRLTSALVLVISFLFARSPVLWAQTGQASWSNPTILYDGSGKYLTLPRFVADPAGGGHLLWQVQTGADNEKGAALYYSRLTGTRWSAPIDVLLAPDLGPARSPAAALDNTGRLHVIFSGAGLYYSSVPADQAGKAAAWSPVRTVAGYSFSSDILADRKGVLHIVYAAAGGDVFYIQSVNGGVSWSSPVAVSQIPSDTATDVPRIAVDSTGVIHAVWQQNPMPQAYPPTGVFYARSGDGGRTWTPPRQLAQNDYGEPAIAVDGSGNVYVAWNGDARLKGRYYRWSKDGGKTWSEMGNITNGSEGLTGSPRMAVDSGGTVHLVTSDTIGEQSGSYYSYWTGTNWTAPALVSPAVGNRWYGEKSEIGVAEGNLLFVFAPAGQARLWYASRVLGSPHLDAQPRATPAPTQTLKPTEPPKPVVQARVTATLATGLEESSSVSETSPFTPIVIAVLPALAILILIVLVRALSIRGG